VPARHQRRARADALGRHGGLLEYAFVVHHAGQQALLQRLARIQDAALEQDFQDHRRADQGEQAGHLARIHREPQAVDRRAEACRLARDADVAATGDLQPAAHAGAADRRHGGHGAVADRVQRARTRSSW